MISDVVTIGIGLAHPVKWIPTFGFSIGAALVIPTIVLTGNIQRNVRLTGDAQRNVGLTGDAQRNVGLTGDRGSNTL